MRNFIAPFRRLRWKLTLSYTAVTVGALLAVELLAIVAVLVFIVPVIYNSDLVPQALVQGMKIFAAEVCPYLEEEPPDVEGLAGWLDTMSKSDANLMINNRPVDIGEFANRSSPILVVGADGTLLGVSHPDVLPEAEIGELFDPEMVPGSEQLIQAALADETDYHQLYAFADDTTLVAAVPIISADDQHVLGTLIMIVRYTAPGAFLGGTALLQLIALFGQSLLCFTTTAGIIGTVFGFLTARGLVRRLHRLAEAGTAWSQGDFAVVVHDPSGDELGQLAQRMNVMAEQIQNLLDTRRELAVIEERNRLARDLHDSAKQQAFATAAQLSAARALINKDPQAAEGHLAEAEKLAYDLRQELTLLIQELRPPMLAGEGLANSLRAYIADWSHQNDIQAEARVQGERPLPLDIEQTLFRIAQEALSNVARHSRAASIEVVLSIDDRSVRLMIRDDGKGFDPDTSHDGFGLRSMQERIESLGGTLSITSTPGKGTRLTICCPLEKSEEYAHD
ncbi:MAG: HAMP domain-containing protein [Anaerolineae bacterium]|nr:HAMP domain-containing protein [Anaerolineae bacterium]